MTFEFTTAPLPGAVAVRLSGRLTLGPRLLEFGRQVNGMLVAQKPSGVLLDMADVVDIDSAGLGELVILFTAAGEQGCRLCLLHPTPRTIRLLETTRLSGILTWFDHVPDAVAWVQCR